MTSMAFKGVDNDAGDPGTIRPLGPSESPNGGPRVLGARKLFMRKQPGAPGKLGKSSTKAESLSKLRGKGALA